MKNTLGLQFIYIFKLNNMLFEQLHLLANVAKFLLFFNNYKKFQASQIKTARRRSGKVLHLEVKIQECIHNYQIHDVNDIMLNKYIMKTVVPWSGVTGVTI